MSSSNLWEMMTRPSLEHLHDIRIAVGTWLSKFSSRLQSKPSQRMNFATLSHIMVSQNGLEDRLPNGRYEWWWELCSCLSLELQVCSWGNRKERIYSSGFPSCRWVEVYSSFSCSCSSSALIILHFQVNQLTHWRLVMANQACTHDVYELNKSQLDREAERYDIYIHIYTYIYIYIHICMHASPLGLHLRLEDVKKTQREKANRGRKTGKHKWTGRVKNVAMSSFAAVIKSIFWAKHRGHMASKRDVRCQLYRYIHIHTYIYML